MDSSVLNIFYPRYCFKFYQTAILYNAQMKIKGEVQFMFLFLNSWYELIFLIESYMIWWFSLNNKNKVSLQPFDLFHVLSLCYY